jgi:hypothetical protein
MQNYSPRRDENYQNFNYQKMQNYSPRRDGYNYQKPGDSPRRDYSGRNDYSPRRGNYEPQARYANSPKNYYSPRRYGSYESKPNPYERSNENYVERPLEGVELRNWRAKDESHPAPPKDQGVSI